MNPEGFLVLLCQKPRLVGEPEKATVFNDRFEDGPLTVEVCILGGQKHGQPITGAKVEVNLGEKGSAEHQVVARNVFPGSNREGIANFELTRRNYWVSAAAEGYRAGKAPADLREGDELTRVWLSPVEKPKLEDPDASGGMPSPAEPEPEFEPEPKQPAPPQEPAAGMADLRAVVVGPRGERLPGATVALLRRDRGVRVGISGRDGTIRFGATHR